MTVLPSDSYIADAARYRQLVRAALDLARAPGNLVVFGVPPTRPETGYGYIEAGKAGARVRGIRALAVRRFTEKPALPLARRYVASGKYFWNAGIFFWRVSTFLECLRRFLPATHSALMRLAETIGTREIRRGAAANLSHARKYFRGLRHHGARHSRRPAARAYR